MIKLCLIPKLVFIQTLIIWMNLFSPSATYAQQDKVDVDKETLNQAIQAWRNGSYDSAMKFFNILLQIRSEKDSADPIPVAITMVNLGAIKSQLGLYDSAISYYEKALSIFEAAGDKELKYLAPIYQNLGICYNAKGDIEKARTYYENADRIFQQLQMSNQRNYEILLINLTLFYLDHNNLSEAERCNNKSFEINPQSSFNYKKWNSSGLISLEKKEYDKSIALFHKAIKIGEQNLGTDFVEKGTIYLNLGMVYLEMEDFENAQLSYKIALQLIEDKIGRQGTAYSSCLKDMGLSFLRKKESESNLKMFIMQSKKNIETSLDFFQKAIIAITPGFTSEDKQINPDPENAIDKIRLLDALKNKAEALFLLSQLEEQQENNEASARLLKSALDSYELSIKIIHLIRNGFQNPESRLFLSENEHPVYADAIKVAVRLYEKTRERQYFEKGFEISERSRSSDFQSMMREMYAKKFSDLPDSLLQRETELKAEISAYENFIFNEKSNPAPDLKKINSYKDKVFSLNQSYQQMISFIEKTFPQYYTYKYADPIVSVQKIQQSLDRREAFIEFFLNIGKKDTDGEIYTFVITDNEFKIIRKPITSDLNGTIDHFLKFIKNGMVINTRKADYIQYTRSAFDLYKLLIEPVVPSMQNYRLVIVPDDKLSYLPFDAFLSTAADTTKMDFRNLDYLVHHHAISYTYSGTLLYYYFQNNLKYSNKIGAFAPDYTDEPLASGSGTDRFLPLPGAVAEVTGVTELIAGDQFIKSNATKQKFLQNAEKYDILHLAMHTMLNDTLPLYSKMVFSADSTGKSDRTLNTYEIYNLKLKSDMVVLSGCNTGSGRLQKGEGVMSLARGFLYAGCPSIIMTLWNVEDISSSVMMIEFYRNIKNGYSKDEALRRAKINYISKADPLKAHPHYWLGYVSIGKQTPLFKTKAGYFVSLIIFVFLAIVLEKWYFKRKKRLSRKNDQL